MAEKAQLRVRCKQGSLVIAGEQIGVEPGLARWWRPRWRIPCADVTALSASRGLGVTLTLTLHTRDDRQLSVEWLLPHDAQSVANALGYTVSVYDLYEMAAEHALGTPFSYDVLTLEPAPPSTPAAPTLPATPSTPATPIMPTAPTSGRLAEPDFGPQWPVVRILPASETPPPPPSIPERRPSRLRALAAVLQMALLAALAALNAQTGALSKRLDAWQMSRSGGQRAPDALSSTPLPERIRGWLAAALASAPTLPARSAPIARAWVRRMRDTLQSLQRTLQAQKAASGWRGVISSLVAAAVGLLRNRIASATLLVALILAVVVASLGATPSRTRYADPSVTAEIGRILPRQAPGKLSHAPATPIPSPTPTSAPTPTPSPAPAPAPAPPPPALTLAFTCAWAQNGRLAQVCVHTQPGASLTIHVTYCDGRSARNRNLQGTVQADAAGNYTWTWVPATRCIGPATAVVTARWQGQTTSATITFDVVPLPPPADSPLPLQTA